MAKRRTVVLDTDPDDDDIDLSPPEDELSQVLGELDGSGGGFVKVERIREGKRPEFVGELSPSGFSLSLLQERFGGGDYTVTVFDSQRRYRKRSTVAVAQPLRSPMQEAPPSAIEKLLAVMQASMKQQQDTLAALVTRSQAPAAAADPQEMRRGILQDLALMKTLVGGGESQQLGPDKILEVLKTGMQIAKEAAAGGEVDMMTVLGKAVDVLGEPFADLLRARAVVPAAPGGQIDPRRLPVAGAAPVAAKPKQGGGMNMQQAVAFLVNKAAAGADPGLYADLVLDNVPEAMLKPVLAGDVVATLSQIDPRVADHAQWFRDLGAMLSEALRPDDAGTGSTAPPADGNAGSDSVGS